MSLLIDSDTHLFEPSRMWKEYVDPADRDVALHMETDDLGYTWLMFGDRRLSLGGPHRPGDVDGIGIFRQRLIDGLPAEFDLEEFNASYSDPSPAWTSSIEPVSMRRSCFRTTGSVGSGLSRMIYVPPWPT